MGVKIPRAERPVSEPGVANHLIPHHVQVRSIPYNSIHANKAIVANSTILASYQLCNTPEALSIALKELGDQGGILSILSLGCVTSISEVKNSATLSIFLINVPAFEKYTHQGNSSPLAPVFSNLTSKEVLKVDFDL
ncbi:SubName: Full=Uncharacterized protein {ECO:0000313/EMBL:CCA74328.1} [Serendipita indica DSM 11827]|nr:SubName: Full=Uncharacterized protein {ECO:0000313/EMBL:CCA74328.1} [Serendipita indica DSM 11827]